MKRAESVGGDDLAQPLLPTLNGNDNDRFIDDEELGGSLLGEEFLPPIARGKKPPSSRRVTNHERKGSK